MDTRCNPPEIILQSEISCPYCGTKTKEIMPEDACQFFYECPGCHVLLKPNQGDCCVFCSFGSVSCPPKQSDKPCC